MTKKMLFDVGFAIETDNPEATKTLLVRAINAALLCTPDLKWMGGPVGVANVKMREVTPKMLELAEALVEAKLKDPEGVAPRKGHH